MNFLLRILLVIQVFCLATFGASANKPTVSTPKLPYDVLDTKAKQAILIDLKTGTIVFEKNAHERMAPSSMSKLMTAYVVFSMLKNKELSLDQKLTVSENAFKKKGSRMFLEMRDTPTIEQLIYGLVVQSGNDAATVLAEAIAGSESGFGRLMTAKAKEIGLKGSHFVNPSGLPDDEHYMTTYDLAMLAKRIYNDFPEYYHYFSTVDYTYNNITQPNMNPLLYHTIPADGLKTGHTNSGGYGLTASVEKDGLRFILVINGLRTMWNRGHEAKKLVDWGYRMFRNVHIFKKDEVVEVADVWLGAKEAVPLVVKDDVVVNMLKRARNYMKVSMKYVGPLIAPIKRDTKVGEITVTAPKLPPQTYPLYAKYDVKKLSGFARLKSALKYLIYGADKRSIDENGDA
jgi:serine-type D-Ala-D-Ala carboxypeptidase (penicillin-binding protein 5/6)